MKYYKHASNNVHYKKDGDQLYFWAAAWAGKYNREWQLIENKERLKNIRIIITGLKPIDAKLYSCPLCQNTGRIKGTARNCSCTQNPFSIANKLS